MLEFCMSGHVRRILRRSSLAQIMKAFIGLFTCVERLPYDSTRPDTAAAAADDDDDVDDDDLDFTGR